MKETSSFLLIVVGRGKRNPQLKKINLGIFFRRRRKEGVKHPSERCISYLQRHQARSTLFDPVKINRTKMYFFLLILSAF